ncbi:hypothetical protein SVIO_050000 [Streptomyces violaceusniger]|uniref:Uncharacterized protein n=1 Tax=Streptomyces violaceusniger TaxID=68280 RepID=A0A4D4L6T8_STRVO|nr:hypothetical protein SVIO_050000 [Streptomyces violaceusniger]
MGRGSGHRDPRRLGGNGGRRPRRPHDRRRPASAAASCAYPYVCLFKDGVRIGQFQDVTSGFQSLPSKPTGTASSPITVTNTRHDDVAYIRFNTGTTVCLPRSTAPTSPGR